MRLPTIKELSALVRELKPTIGDEYRAPGCEDDTAPSMQLTVGWQESGEWSYQTGDNSFTGGAYSYPHWAVVTIDRRSDSRAIAREIRDQLAELASQ